MLSYNGNENKTGFFTDQNNIQYFSQILLSSSRSIDDESEGEHNPRERVESLTIHHGHLY